MTETPSPVNPFKKTTAAARRANTFSIAAIALAIIAGGIAWLAWKEAYRITELTKAYTHQIFRQTQSSTQTEQLTIAKFKTQLDDLQTKFDKTQNKVDQLSTISLKTRDQRALNEAAYLMHLANLQVSILRNTNAAQQLMTLAQQQLAMITDTNVTKLKISVAKDIMALKNSPDTNVSHLLTQLDQLKIKISALPIFPIKTLPANSTNDTKKSNTALPWHNAFNKNIDRLKKLIIIRHDVKPIKPLLSSEELTFLKQNVQIKISEAEWALLYENPTVYQQSLQSAKQMLEIHYPNQAAMGEALSQIQALSTVNIKPKLPNLSTTLHLLKQVSLEGST